MKNVCVITTNFAINYGARLQEYSLYRKLKELGYTVEVLNYTPNSGYHGRRDLYEFSNIKSSINSFLKLVNISYRRAFKKRVELFDEFERQHIKIFPRYPVTKRNAYTALRGYDALICGSDQIWNLKLFDDEIFFLPNFNNSKSAQDKLTKIISYAASLGETEKEGVADVANKITHFDALSVRENSASTLLSMLLKRDISTVIDPVFLTNKNQWLEIMKKVSVPHRYILSYEVASDSNYAPCLKQLRAATGLPIVSIDSRPFNKYKSEYHLTDVGPSEFLWLINKAAYVITSSFHATAFALMFDRPLFVIPNTLRASRHETILDLFNERKLIIKSTGDVSELLKSFEGCTKYDRSKVDLVINDSIDYLIESLTDNI